MNCTGCGEPKALHLNNGVHCPDSLSAAAIYTIDLKARITAIVVHEINSALQRTGGDVTAAARAITMSRRTIIHKIIRHEIDVEGHRSRATVDPLAAEIDSRIDAIGGGA